MPERRKFKVPTLEQVQGALISAVPSGKALIWLIVTGISVFLAGVGFTLRSNEYTSLPAQHAALEMEQDSLEHVVQENRISIALLRAQVDSASADRRQILCLVTLTATGEQLTPLQVRQRCP